ncbi:MAG: aminotransferase class V-fold PLP-dependent enzyme [Clostridia bacterium]|nr:aminotransferase class V-fold PLP-dependent enzyme [Clostridia bacterium]
MVYLDNAATSYPKPAEVYEKVIKAMHEAGANPGRSSHEMARASATAVMNTRELLATLFHIDNPLQIGFTCNATLALNMAIHGLLKKGDHVVTSAMEHNSVLRPLYELKKRGRIDYTVVYPDNMLGEMDPSQISKAIRHNTRLIILTASSNVTGTVMPYQEIGEIALKKGILFLLDASQGAGVLPIDVKGMNISLMAFPGHKSLLGPQGTGGLYVDERVELRPILQGGTGSRSFETIHPSFMPDMAEAGTLNTPGIAGLGAAVEWILKTGQEAILQKKELLIQRLYERLSESSKITLYSKVGNHCNSGIVAFIINGVDSSETGNSLDSDYKIAVRSGFHCAPLAHKALQTENSGLVRLSPGYFNTLEEMNYAADCILELAAKTP